MHRIFVVYSVKNKFFLMVCIFKQKQSILHGLFYTACLYKLMLDADTRGYSKKIFVKSNFVETKSYKS